LESRAQGGTDGVENSLLQTVTSYTVFYEMTVSANACMGVHSTSTIITVIKFYRLQEPME